MQRSVAASIASILELELSDVPVPDEAHPEPWTVWRNWLARRGLGLVPISEPSSFNWPGPWLAVLRAGDGEGFVGAVAFGAPPGLAWHPLGGRETFEAVELGYVIAPHDVALWTPPSRTGARPTGVVEAVVIAPAAEAEELHVVALYDELPVVVSPKGHPIVAFESVTLADLAGETMLEADGMTSAQLLEVVATGAGLAIVPMSVARALGGDQTRHRVVTDVAPTTIALAWLQTADSPLHQELIGIARGRRPGSSRGADREHSVEPGQSATGGKPPSRVTSARMLRAKGKSSRGHSTSSTGSSTSGSTVMVKMPQ